MTAIVEGVFKEGKIELRDIPSGLREGPVRVIVLMDESAKSPPCFLRYGKYQGGRESTLEDFQEAQWHGEEEFENPSGQ